MHVGKPCWPRRYQVFVSRKRSFEPACVVWLVTVIEADEALKNVAVLIFHLIRVSVYLINANQIWPGGSACVCNTYPI